MEKKDQLIEAAYDLYRKMDWLNALRMKDDRFEDYKSSEIHCIESIGKHADSNVTKLAESFYMTRGAISKLTKKLIQKGAVESYQKPDNKKEVYFRLTEQGQKIFQLHESLHQEFAQRDQLVYDQLTEEQFNNILGFVENYRHHLDAEIKKLAPDMKSDFPGFSK